jgi:hypothetical protein
MLELRYLIELAGINLSLLIDFIGIFQQSYGGLVHFIVLKLRDLVVEDVLPGYYVGDFLFDFNYFFAQSHTTLFVLVGEMFLCPFLELSYPFLLTTDHILEFFDLFSQAKFHTLDFAPLLTVHICCVMGIKDKRSLVMLEHPDHLLPIQFFEEFQY